MLRAELAVVGFVFLIAVLNLALGYLAAAALSEAPFWEHWRLRWPGLPMPLPKRAVAGGMERPPIGRASTPSAPSQQVAAPAAGSAASVAEPAAAKPPAPLEIAGVNELPPQWIEQLAAEGIVPQSFVEGAAHALRLEVSRYREQLIAAEHRGRALAAGAEAAGLKLLADDLQSVNQDWLKCQTTAAEMLAKRAGRFGDHEAAAEALEHVLREQTAEIRAICGCLADSDLGKDLNVGGKSLLEQTATLVDHAHALRDRMLDLLATLLWTGKGMEMIGSGSQLDPLTGVANRIGLDGLLAAWWRDDPQRSRPLGVALIDIDRFARVNQRLGTRAGDQAILAFSRLFMDVIRKDRGYDRLARVGGQSFVVVLGDTGPREALTAAERLRQTVEATTFDNQGVEFELTVSCGVVEVGSTDSVAAMLRRATEALKFAKKAGRNRCALDEGSGPTTIDPPRFPVKGRVVKLGEG